MQAMPATGWWRIREHFAAIAAAGLLAGIVYWMTAGRTAGGRPACDEAYFACAVMIFTPKPENMPASSQSRMRVARGRCPSRSPAGPAAMTIGVMTDRQSSLGTGGSAG